MLNMTMHTVESSNIHQVGYDPATQTLRVAFHSGVTYDYAGVAHDLFQELLSAESVGKVFHSKVRLGGFVATKLGGEKAA